tara:strand:- start:10664 stop:11149 length:486 start_codon:yes stop_codon:yes gene_type:complete
MKVRIKGSNKKTRKYCEQVVWWCASKFMNIRLLSGLKINVKLIRSLYSKEDSEGECTWENWDGYYRPKEFTIILDSTMKRRNILMTLMHEMVHVKQYAKGEMMEYCKNGMIRYHKTKYDENNIDYWDEPWEIEAYGRQLGLFVRWCEECGYDKVEEFYEIP